MTEFDIQRALFAHFVTLNERSGTEFLHTDGEGRLTNVHFPNVPFTPPDSKRWFALSLTSSRPSDVAVMDGTQSRIDGVLYIDIITPQDAGEDECETKYRWIARLFNGKEIGDVDITRVYVSTRGNEADHYRLQAAVEWTADIDKET